MDLGKLNVYKLLKLAQKICNEAYSFQLTFCNIWSIWTNVPLTLKSINFVTILKILNLATKFSLIQNFLFYEHNLLF